MRHLLGGRLRVSWQATPIEINAGCNHQPVRGERRAAAEGDTTRLRIDRGGGRESQFDASGCNVVVAKLLLVEIAQAADHQIAERAGSECALSRDESNGNPRIGLLERTC